jgi:DNA-binding transcriptional MerR regulator
VADDKSTEKRVLEPVEPSELLKRLKLSTGKAAAFAGVSRRQLCYWTDTGIISPLDEEDEEDRGDAPAATRRGGDDDPSRRSYDFEALHRVLLIDQVMKHYPGLRRAAREVDQHLAARQRRAEELASSIEQKREEFLTEQADRLETLATNVRELLPKVFDRAALVEIHDGLEWLDRLTERVLGGQVLLEEDASACLRLATLVEQAEAKIENLTAGP